MMTLLFVLGMLFSASQINTNWAWFTFCAVVFLAERIDEGFRSLKEVQK